MLSVLDSDLPLDKIIFAGEVFPHPALCRLRQLFPRARMWNWYGPTETNVLTSYELAPGPPPYPLPLGRAVPYAQIELSAEGEILAQGASLMLGHLGQSPLGKIYATGDLGYFDQEGLLYFSGRRDSLIKSRGHRIELGEIKAALEAQAFEAEVIAVTDAEYGKKIIAFIKAPAPMREVWSGLKKRLPKYMMPVRIIELDDFPLSASGKKDLQALHQLYSSTSQ